MPSGIPRPWVRPLALLMAVVAACGLAGVAAAAWLVVPEDPDFADLRRSIAGFGWTLAASAGAVALLAGIRRRQGELPGAVPAPSGAPPPAAAGLARLRPVHAVESDAGITWWRPVDRADSRRFTLVLALALPFLVAIATALVRPWGDLVGDVIFAAVVLAAGELILAARLPLRARRDAAQPRLAIAGDGVRLILPDGETAIAAPTAVRLTVADATAAGFPVLAVELVWDGGARRTTLAATVFGCAALARQAQRLAAALGVPLQR